jgi:hypothetical protein
MYVGADFSNVDVGETISLAFDYTNDLAADETIASVTWQCLVAANSPTVDPSPAQRISGAPGIAGNVVSQVFAGFIGNVRYLIEAFATTNQGDVLSLWSHVYCDIPD